MKSVVPFLRATSTDHSRRNSLGGPVRRPSRILIATDFSTRSHRALRRASMLARDHGDASLCLLHVVDGSRASHLVQRDVAEARRMLADQITSMPELRDLDCRTQVCTGRPHEQIVTTAAAERADIIVMGTHRRRLLQELCSDRTAERVIRGAGRPLLFVECGPHRPYERVLVPVDGSAVSTETIRAADALGFVAGPEVTLLHAFTAFAKGKLMLAGVGRDEVADYISSERDQARALVSSFLASNGLASRPWMLRLGEGGPFEVIAREVERRRPDLLVIGTTGRSGVSRMLFGSVAEEAVRSLDVDILVVPACGRVAEPPDVIGVAPADRPSAVFAPHG